MGHFWEELQGQAGRSRKPQNLSQHSEQHSTHQPSTHRPSGQQPNQRTTHEARQNEPAHDQPPNGGFISHFVDEVRSQFRGGDKR